MLALSVFLPSIQNSFRSFFAASVGPLQILTALDYVHSLRLIHCDLKPAEASKVSSDRHVKLVFVSSCRVFRPVKLRAQENILIKSYSRCEVKAPTSTALQQLQVVYVFHRFRDVFRWFGLTASCLTHAVSTCVNCVDALNPIQYPNSAHVLDVALQNCNFLVR